MMMQSANGPRIRLAGQFKEKQAIDRRPFSYSPSSVRRLGRMKSNGLLRK
jgi:hypothetical protein